MNSGGAEVESLIYFDLLNIRSEIWRRSLIARYQQTTSTNWGNFSNFIYVLEILDRFLDFTSGFLMFSGDGLNLGRYCRSSYS